MDISDLERVLAVREHGSFARAAAALRIAQPSLSKAMARLEAELGAPLFERHAAGCRPTAAGELVATRAERVLAQARGLARDAALVAGGEAGQLRLGVGGALRSPFLDRLAPALAARHPALRLELTLAPGRELVRRLRRREFDLVFSADGHRLDDTLVATPILSAPVIVAAAPGHPLAGQHHLTAEQLAQHRLASGSLAFRSSDLYARPDDAPTTGAFMANDYGALIALAQAGHCALAAPRFVVAEAIARGTLVALDVDWTLQVTFAAITTPTVAASPLIRSAIAVAQEVGAGLG